MCASNAARNPESMMIKWIECEIIIIIIIIITIVIITIIITFVLPGQASHDSSRDWSKRPLAPTRNIIFFNMGPRDPPLSL